MESGNSHEATYDTERYAAPKIEVIGRVAEVTLGHSGQGVDSIGNAPELGGPS
jgi:hypothetical protein